MVDNGMAWEAVCLRKKVVQEINAEVEARKLAAQQKMMAEEPSAYFEELDRLAADIIEELYTPDSTVESILGFDWWNLLP